MCVHEVAIDAFTDCSVEAARAILEYLVDERDKFGAFQKVFNLLHTASIYQFTGEVFWVHDTRKLSDERLYEENMFCGAN